MNMSLLRFIRETVRVENVPFYYYKDKYAIDLLLYALWAEEVSIYQLKKSHWGFLLQKPSIQKILASLPNQRLSQEKLRHYWRTDSRCYKLSIGQWGKYSKHRNDDWYQTSRPGVNLVLQLNFDEEHNQRYYRLIRPKKYNHPFENDSHPIAERRHTLAWARMDVDLDTGEVLIEEIQNDWVRNVKDMIASLAREERYWIRCYSGMTPERLRRYYQEEIRRHERVWDEAVLAAALWFVRQELGISRIYYHTFATGNIMKQLTAAPPPRSLYTKLPRRFGFRETDEAPQFLRQDQYLKKMFRKHSDLKWFVLNI